MKRIKMTRETNVTFEDGCNKYLDYCKERNLREGTIKHYRQSYLQFYKYFDKDMLIKYCQGIQSSSPVDSCALPVPGDMPGYDDQVIMAAGAFTQGSSIELSCDGPVRPPYIAYQQGSLTYEYGKLALIGTLMEIEND